MSTPLLTAAAVRRLKPTAVRREVPDKHGLYLVIQSTGHKSWALRFRRPDGTKAKLTLGPVDVSDRELADDPVLGQALTLAAARALAASINRQRMAGSDVIADYAAAKRRRRSESEEKDSNTFATVLRRFFAEHVVPKKGRKPRRWRETARVLGLVYQVNGDGEPSEMAGGLAAAWRDRDIRSIDGHDIYAATDGARRHGIPGLGRRNKGLSDARGRNMARALSVVFSWALEHRKITVDPTLGAYCPPPPPARERVLGGDKVTGDDELRWFWKGCDALGYPFGPLCQLLLLLGVRREEARRLSRAELSADGTLWSLSGERTKNGKPYELPLPPLARAIIAAAPRIESPSGLVFTISGGPLGGFAKAKRRLDAAMLAAARAERGQAITITPFVLHDLRRSFASGLQRLGVTTEVIEHCLNHVSGSFGGVAGIYQRDPLLAERRIALERWAAHIKGLLSDTPSNVVAIPRKGDRS